MIHERLRRCCVALMVAVLVVGVAVPVRAAPVNVGASDGGNHPNVKSQDNGDGTWSFLVWDNRPEIGQPLPCASGFDAACWSIGGSGFGRNPLGLSELERAYLSDARFSPAFCDFAESFAATNMPGIGLPGGFVSLPGAYHYASNDYSYDNYLAARTEFDNVTNGRYPTIGGGGDGLYSWSGTSWFSAYGYTSLYYLLGNQDGRTVRWQFCIMPNGDTISEGYLYKQVSDTFSVTIDESAFVNFLAELPEGVEFDYLSNIGDMRGGSISYTVYAVPHGSYELVNGADGRGTVHCNGFRNTSNSSFKYYWTSRSFSSYVTDGSSLTCTPSVPFSSGSDVTLSVGETKTFNSNTSFRISYAGSAGEPVEPEPTWPGNPTVEPTPPPDVPEPDPPVSPEPDPPVVTQPTLPDPPSNPTIPVDPVTPEPEPTGTSPQDYTPWLRAILRALNRLDSSLASHCQHLQQRMHTEMLWWYNAFTQWFNPVYIAFCQFLNDWAVYFDDLLEGTLDEQTYEMEQWLRELFVWLADQFEFTFTGSPVTVEPGEGGDSGTVSFDDSSIVYWLKMIYNAIQDLDISPTTKPDIGSDANGFWEWLNAILAGIVAGLVAGVLGVIAGFTDAIDALTDKFPFSLPWDIAAMLALLAHDPVTPVFDLPLASPDGTVVDCHVDMSDWDGVMANVRAMELLLFGLALAKRTPDMIDAVKDIF